MAEPAKPAPPAAGVAERDVLLATKLRVPRPHPGFLPRQRLLERLVEGAARELTLVCAPAGFGKTSLLGDWARRGQWPVAWLSLDVGDNDPARFWRYAAAALDQVCEGVGGQVAALSRGPQPPLEAVVTVVVNQFASQSGRVVLVVDDYHLIDAAPVHASVELLLERLPGSLWLVLASRADPPLPLARLRARGQLAELRAADLRFTGEETTTLLREVMGLELPAGSVEALAARTEGWAAGLQLAALSLRGQTDVVGFVTSFSGSHRYVLDYLADEVLARQPEETVRFLLETSVLDRLSGPLCDAVTGRDDSQALLEQIERANLFVVPLDDVRGWWRYHQLFADLLRARLQQQRPERVQELHRAAAAWSEAHGLVDDAVRHALAADDPAWAGQLVEQHLDQTLRRGEGVMLRRRLEALPAEVVRSRPGLVLAQAMLQVHRGRLDEAERLLEHADRAVDRQPDPEHPKLPTDGGMVSQVPAAIALLRAELAAARGDPEQTARFARSALAHLCEGEVGPRLWARYLLAVADWLAGRVEQAEPAFTEVLAEGRVAAEPHPLLSACLYLGEVQRARGRLGTALATYREALEFAAHGAQPSTFHAADAHVGLGQVLYGRNQLDDARQHLTEGLALSRPLGLPQLSGRALVTMAWIRQATGDPDGAQQAMDEACALMPGTQTRTWYHPAPAERARLLLAQGQVDQAARWAEEQELKAEDEPSYLRERDQLVLARVLLAGRAPERALGLLGRLHALAAAQGRIGSVVEVRALQALALDASGDHVGGLAALAEALTLAATEGWLRVFVDEGAPMAALLGKLAAALATRQAAAAGRPPAAHLGWLLDAFERAGLPVLARPRRGGVAVVGVVEPLTARQLEVLRLLAAGKPNQAIAGELVVTLETVKSHVGHILDKLGATNRTQAVSRARELGLLR